MRVHLEFSFRMMSHGIHLLAVDDTIVAQFLNGQDDVAAKSYVVSCQSHSRQGTRFPSDSEQEDSTGVDGRCFDRNKPPTPAAHLRIKVSQSALPVIQLRIKRIPTKSVATGCYLSIGMAMCSLQVDEPQDPPK
jgi:hypothetical protein